MIERIYVNNFRCLENFTLDLVDRPSVLLIGRNGAGKSTVLAALKILQTIARGPNRVKEAIKEKDFGWHKTDRPIRLEVDIRLDGKMFKYCIAFEWPDGFREARVFEESLTAGSDSVFERSKGEVKLSDGTIFGLDWHIFGLPVIGEKPPADSISKIRNYLSSMILLNPIPQYMYGFSEEPASEIDLYALNFAACLRGLLDEKPSAYGQLESFLKNVMSDFSVFTNSREGKDGKDGRQLTVTFQPSESNKPMSLEFDHLSDGEKCFMLAAYVVAANATQDGVFCFWDEPDNHLAISEVGHLVTMLRRMTNQGGQFIATSHHPQTVSEFSDNNTFVLAKRSHLEPTIVKPLDTFEYDGDLIDALSRNEIIG